MKNISLILLFLVALVGCRNDAQQSAASTPAPAPAATTASTTITPEQLGVLGAKIRKDPNRAEQLLADHGLNAETFEQAVRRVTEDPAASKRYAAAFRNEV